MDAASPPHPSHDSAAADALAARVWRELGGSEADPARPASLDGSVPLPARTDVSALALAAVAVAGAAAASFAGAAFSPPDPDRVAVSFASERYLRIDGAVPAVWAPLSGFFPTADGWVRTHGNYPHHASILRSALGLSETADADAVAAALASSATREACRRIERAGGLCVAVRREVEDADEALRRDPIVQTRRLSGGSARASASTTTDAPLRGIRVLDLTRVIAGPVATRTLALLGADVLRLDPVDLPEKDWQHLDTGHGKRSALLTATTPRGRAAMHALLDTADVLVTGYRPAAAARLGLDPEAVAAAHPGLVVARLSAWGFDDAALDRRGFDSLVQADSGIAWIEATDPERPGALPAQALDHSAGYLLAAAVIALLARRSAEGGSWLAQVSLRRIAAELLGMPRTAEPSPAGQPDPAAHLQTFHVDGVELVTAAPAIAYEGGPEAFAAPRPWGRDEPAWSAS